MDIYRNGFNKGYKCGYMFAILERLKIDIEKAERILDD